MNEKWLWRVHAVMLVFNSLMSVFWIHEFAHEVFSGARPSWLLFQLMMTCWTAYLAYDGWRAMRKVK